ncbi:hypothetical protein C804_00095 [Lachnospiraceae bacterium A4]|nr:hypothetical protein C804_00095 [Lachnospiraceae bacterium A4]
MKKGKVLGLFAMSATLLTGCIDAMPELTAEQSDIITEYAAGLLLKYSPNYNYRIADEEEVLAAMAARQEAAEAESETAAETEPETDSAQPEEETNQNTSSTETETEPETEQIQFVADLDFAAELGIDDLIIRYQSFEVCSAYPGDNTGFSVDAAQGKKLLVMHFDLEGLPEEDIDCNLFDYELKMRVNINDSGSVPVLSTLIPNDLGTYMDIVPAGEIVDVVAVAEIDDMTAEEIQTLTLYAASNSQSCAVKLK